MENKKYNNTKDKKYDTIINRIVKYKKGKKIRNIRLDELTDEELEKRLSFHVIKFEDVKVLAKQIDTVCTEYSKLYNYIANSHLMKKYIEDYALMNTSIIIFHYEAVKDINEMINIVKSYGLKVGIAINPETNINVLYPNFTNVKVSGYINKYINNYVKNATVASSLIQKYDYYKYIQK